MSGDRNVDAYGRELEYQLDHLNVHLEGVILPISLNLVKTLLIFREMIDIS